MSLINATSAALSSPASAMGAAQLLAWGAVRAALVSGGTVSIVMLGGSMARGQGCTPDPSAADACAYAARVVTRLRRAYPTAKILFENRAVGGMTTGSTLLSLPTISTPVASDDDRGEADASVLLVDFGINDNFEAQTRWTQERKARDKEAYIALKLSQKQLSAGELIHRQVFAATEAMLRYLLEHRPTTAVLVMDGTCWLSATRRTHVAHSKAAAYYGVPYFGFPAALPLGVATQSTLQALPKGADVCRACIRPRTQCNHSSFPVYFSDGKHPDHRGHELVADALAAVLDTWWRDGALASPLWDSSRPRTRRHPHTSATTAPKQSMARALPPPISDPMLRAQHAVCAAPTTLHTAAEQVLTRSTATEQVSMRGWQLYEDRKGKPGWISTGPNGSSIDFRVRFGIEPRLTFVYTLGYEGFARVALSFPSLSARNRQRYKMIEGLRSDGLRVTQAAVLEMDVGHMHHGSRLDLAYGVAGWAIKPNAQETFRAELLCNPGTTCGKFKILAIRAC